MCDKHCVLSVDICSHHSGKNLSLENVWFQWNRGSDGTGGLIVLDIIIWPSSGDCYSALSKSCEQKPTWVGFKPMTGTSKRLYTQTSEGAR